MSYLFVVVLGAIAGWIAGQVFKGNDNMGIMPDLAAGAAGAIVMVFLARVFAGVAAAGYVVSTIVAIAGGAATLYAMRYVMKETPVPVRRRR